MGLKNIHLSHWDKVFWIFFLVLGVVVTIASFVRVVFLDIFLGILIIIIGLEKLSEELVRNRHAKRNVLFEGQLRDIKSQIEKNIEWTKSYQKKNDIRLHRLDAKRNEVKDEMGDLVEEKFESLAKKLIDLENRYNEIARFLVAEYNERKKKTGAITKKK